MPTRRELLAFGPATLAASGASARPGAISFNLWHQDTILLPVRIGGRSWTCLLDTGAASVVIDAAAAKVLELKASGDMILNSATQRLNASTLEPVLLVVGGKTLRVARPVLQDLSAVTASMGHAVDVILGEDLFARFAVDLDFAVQRARLSPAGSAIGPGDKAPLELGPQGRRVTRVEIEDHGAIPAVFDLGSSMPLMVSRHYAQAIGLFDGRRTSTAAVAQITGVEVSTTLSVRSLQFAGQALADVPVEVFDDWRLEQVPVVLGLPALAQFRLAIDYAAAAVFVAKDPSAPARPTLRDLSGLGFAVQPDRLRVVHVARGGPAQGDWRVGEEIVAVNGRRIDSGYGRTLWKWRNGGLGPHVRLTLASGSVRLLDLARYY